MRLGVGCLIAWAAIAGAIHDARDTDLRTVFPQCERSIRRYEDECLRALYRLGAEQPADRAAARTRLHNVCDELGIGGRDECALWDYLPRSVGFDGWVADWKRNHPKVSAEAPDERPGCAPEPDRRQDTDCS
jgi:hypothetical protein